MNQMRMNVRSGIVGIMLLFILVGCANDAAPAPDGPTPVEPTPDGPTPQPIEPMLTERPTAVLPTATVQPTSTATAVPTEEAVEVAEVELATETAVSPTPTPTSEPIPIPLLVISLPPFTKVPEAEWGTLAITELHEQIFAALLERDPEGATQLGLAKHYNIPLDQLNDISDAYRQETFEKIASYITMLEGVDTTELSEDEALSNQILLWDLEQRLAEAPFLYHTYPIRQLFSVHDQLPSLLATDHPLTSRADADAFLVRLQQIPRKFEQAQTAVSTRAERNMLPPRFVFDRVSSQLSRFAATPPEESPLFLGFAARIESVEALTAAEKEAFKTAVLQEIEASVYPAYRNLANFVSLTREQATNEDGVWRFENGRDYYAYTLRHHTTTDLTAAEIHDLGWQEIERIQAEMEPLLIELGYSGSLPRDVGRFYSSSESLRVTDEASREAALTVYRDAVAFAETELAPLFELLPQSPLQVLRVPPFQEAGSPAFYSPPPLDGSRSGIFFVPLAHGTTVSLDGVTTLAIHEGIPGHHFQLSLQVELDTLPTFRRVLSYTSYAEGWALYAERLAAEQGLYADNPRAQLARLIESDLLRAARLVVDTGVHDLGWSRDEALAFMNDIFGFQWTSEVERYIAWPGQATGYKVGELTILRLRAKAQDALGDAFELAEFHTAVLENGALPLFLLEERIDAYIAEKSGQ